jgi:hypothetical protein
MCAVFMFYVIGFYVITAYTTFNITEPPISCVVQCQTGSSDYVHLLAGQYNVLQRASMKHLLVVLLKLLCSNLIQNLNTNELRFLQESLLLELCCFLSKIVFFIIYPH